MSYYASPLPRGQENKEFVAVWLKLKQANSTLNSSTFKLYPMRGLLKWPASAENAKGKWHRYCEIWPNVLHRSWSFSGTRLFAKRSPANEIASLEVNPMSARWTRRALCNWPTSFAETTIKVIIHYRTSTDISSTTIVTIILTAVILHERNSS